MDKEYLQLEEYKEKLNQVELALSVTPPGEDKDNLLQLQIDLKQLLELTQESLKQSTSSQDNTLEDEYSLFMAEMAKEGAVENNAKIDEDLKSLEGMKCRAPYKNDWGDVTYHNALVCTVIPSEQIDYNEIKVKVMYTNPTHNKLLPCHYFLESECKFSEDKCRFSHGEIVAFADLQEYLEPNYEDLSVGSFVLSKQQDRLWHRGTVMQVLPEKCLVRLDTNKKDIQVKLEDVFPLNESAEAVESDSEMDQSGIEDVINMSLLNPVCEKLGDWEKYTKGVGSKLMQKMGYVIGTGLGRRSEGRIEPVSAVVLPPGKSLDHCMELREKAGGDKNLFNLEKKLKRLQRKQEMKNRKNYEKQSKKVDVFNFLNETIYKSNRVGDNEQPLKKSDHRKSISKETCRNLNVECFKIDERMKELERELISIRQGLTRHTDVNSPIHKQLKAKLTERQREIVSLEMKVSNIKNEQSLRNTKKKLVVF